MTGIQANANMLRAIDSVDDFPQFLKATAYLASLARHGFKQYGSFHIRPQNSVEHRGDQFNSPIDPLPYVTARMKIV